MGIKHIIRKCANRLFTFLFVVIVLNYISASKCTDKLLLSNFAMMAVATFLFIIAE